MNILTIDHLYKTYAAQADPAVSNISLRLKKGEITGLVGESGSGKTTLLRLIAGLEDADSGHIRLHKETVTGPAGNLVPGHSQIRLVHQDFKLSPHISVRENIAYTLRTYEVSYRNDRLEKMLWLCELADLQHKLPRQLSGGEMQRVALAKALADEPTILLLDEPFSNVDTIRRQALTYQLRNIICGSGTTALFVTHDTTEALTLSDNVAVMRQGRIIQTGSPPEIYHKPLSPYVAGLFGYANIIQAGQLLPHRLATTTRIPYTPDDYLCIRAEYISICSESDADFAATVRQRYYLGIYSLLEVQIAPLVRCQVLFFEEILPSEKVFLRVDWKLVHVFPTQQAPH